MRRDGRRRLGAPRVPRPGPSVPRCAPRSTPATRPVPPARTGGSTPGPGGSGTPTRWPPCSTSGLPTRSARRTGATTRRTTARRATGNGATVVCRGCGTPGASRAGRPWWSPPRSRRWSLHPARLVWSRRSAVGWCSRRPPRSCWRATRESCRCCRPPTALRWTSAGPGTPSPPRSVPPCRPPAGLARRGTGRPGRLAPARPDAGPPAAAALATRAGCPRRASAGPYGPGTPAPQRVTAPRAMTTESGSRGRRGRGSRCRCPAQC